MKKLITVVFILIMILLLYTLPVFATTNDTMSVIGNKSIDVKAVYVDDVSISKVYSVDISWGAMEFIYTSTGTKTWDPSTNKYDITTDAKWKEYGNTVTVTNHSNVDVTINFEFEKDSAITENITGTFDKQSKKLNAGVENDYNGADSVTTTLTISGELSSARTDFTKIGSVKVTIR